MSKTKNIIICWNDDPRQIKVLKEQIDQLKGRIKLEKENIKNGVGIDYPFLIELKRQIAGVSTVSAIKKTIDKYVIDSIPIEYKDTLDREVAKKIRKSVNEIKTTDIKAFRNLVDVIFENKTKKANEKLASEIVDYDFLFCKSWYELSMNDISTFDGLIVPCELSWDHRGSGYSLNEYKGIDLVQYLRERQNVKAPVVFVSFMSQETIVTRKKEAEIIRAPGLQHGFALRPINLNDVVEMLAKMRPLSTPELKFTQLQYCSIKGLLTQIIHSIGSSSGAVKQEYKGQIEYILQHAFNYDNHLLDEYHQHDKAGTLGEFCRKLYDSLNNQSSRVDKDIEWGFVRETVQSGQIKIAYLEDDVEHDAHAKRFVEYIKKENDRYQEKGYGFLFSLDLYSDPDRLKSRYDEYDVVISDIVLKKDKQLVALGFNVIKELMDLADQKQPLYYIVTNVTRSFYDQIMMPGIRRIRLKEEVFGSETAIAKFLYGIKEVYDARIMVEETSEYITAFSKLMEYAHDETKYAHSFDETKFGIKKLETYKEMEEIIQGQSMILIREFLNNWIENVSTYKKEKYWECFDVVSETMRIYVKDNFGHGNDKIAKNLNKKLKKGGEPDHEDIKNLMIKLILRRYFLFLKEFGKFYGLNDYYNKKTESTVYKCTSSEFVCRAINTLYKGEESTSTQSKCLDETLLYSKALETQDEDAQLTDEEKDFVRTIREVKPFQLTKVAIDKLDLYP